MTHLFNDGLVRLHSGALSHFKIDCDALTPEDWTALAAYAVEVLGIRFRYVYGVPRGGTAFASALSNLAEWWDRSLPNLIVDDVLTTGVSMEEARESHQEADTIGLVVFARGKLPDWIRAIFQMGALNEQS